MKFQFITHYTDKYSYYDSAFLALEGGCKWVQLRMKNSPIEEIKAEAIRIQALCRKYSATFIIDDHVDVVKEIKADGVHLGKNDMPVTQAREILGEGFIIGGTANTFEDVVNLYKSGVDYIGCGPYRFTTTKQNLSPILGLDGYRNIITRMKHEGIDVPLIAIGGINYDDISEIMQTGVTGIALSGTILRAENPIEETKRIIHLL